MQRERRLLARLPMQVSQHAVVRYMHYEAEIRHHKRPGKELGR